MIDLEVSTWPWKEVYEGKRFKVFPPALEEGRQIKAHWGAAQPNVGFLSTIAIYPGRRPQSHNAAVLIPLGYLRKETIFKVNFFIPYTVHSLHVAHGKPRNQVSLKRTRHVKYTPLNQTFSFFLSCHMKKKCSG